MRSIACLASGCAAVLFAAAAATSEPPISVPEPPLVQPQLALPEVLVQAPEPRYVAPTRRDRIGRIWAPVLINGQGPFRLVLDTGASHSAVIERVAQALGVPQKESAILLHGVTGSARVPSIQAERFEIGDVISAPAVLPIVEDAFGGAEGVLGTEGLGDMRIVIEFNADRITIARSHYQRAGPDFSVIPLKFLFGRVPVIAARVGSIPVQAIIDTGAQGTTGNLALRDLLLRRRAPRNVETDDVVGVTLDVQHGDAVIVPEISLGSVTLRRARVTFVDLDILSQWKMLDKPMLVIGMDILGLLDTLVIDYRRREMQVRLKRFSAEGSSS
jgi:hypothetical protein